MEAQVEKLPIKVKGQSCHEKYVVDCPKKRKSIEDKFCIVCEHCVIAVADYVKCRYKKDLNKKNMTYGITAVPE